jgi:hypothetical protein
MLQATPQQMEGAAVGSLILGFVEVIFDRLCA